MCAEKNFKRGEKNFYIRVIGLLWAIDAYRRRLLKAEDGSGGIAVLMITADNEEGVTGIRARSSTDLSSINEREPALVRGDLT
ncbi:hypothetical protein DK870_03325 [Pseudomonas sp. Q1]|nr:hypothetical protein [Pseudomonas sp. Q1]